MRKTTVIASLLLLSSAFAKAQTNFKATAQPDSIIKIIPVGEGRHSGYLYTIGGKLETREDVAIRLLAYAPSAQEYHLAKTNAVWSFVSLGGFGLSGIGATIEYALNNKHAGEIAAFVNGQPGFVYQHHSLAGAYIFTGLATAFVVSSIIHFAHAAHHSNKAIELYNQRFE